jgi:RNA polymerase sigma factor (sigma-70 family)
MELTCDHYRMAAGMARRYPCPGYGTEDLSQEAVIAILVALPGYLPQRDGDEAAYLRCAIHRRLNRLAKRERERHAHRAAVLDPDTPDHNLPPDEQAARREVFSRAAELLSPPKAAVILGTLQGKSAAVMAAELGTNKATVYSQRNQARNQLCAAFA